MIIYQIYPRSFLDTNGDGIGDLKGIAQKLPYIADLGADAVWISPFFTSPMKDFGYDVSDYRGVDPIFGTMQDFDSVMQAAQKAGLKVLIDQVWGHSSIQHPWFQESRKDRKNARQDWYVWGDPKEDGSPPNNWMSIFGGPAWSWSASRRQYYLHHFLQSQPALNWHNDEAFNAVMEDSLFWVQRGVDGFRIDALPHIVADKKLRDNPPIKKGMVSETFTADANPREMQDNIYTQSRPELLPFIERSRRFFRERGQDILLLAEVMTGGLQLAGQCVEGKDRMDMAYTDHLIRAIGHAAPMMQLLQDVQKNFDDARKICWSLGNHDVKRLWSRFREGDNKTEIWRQLISLYFCMEGHLCWYQGDELGLSEADIPFEEIQDPAGLTFWPEYKGRDGCRTPMPWNKNESGAGFTTGKPWLPIPSDHAHQAVNTQDGIDSSFLEHTRLCMTLRRSHQALQQGKTKILKIDKNVAGFIREWEGQKILCLFNLDENEEHKFKYEFSKILYSNNMQDETLLPYGVLIAEI